MDPEREEVIHTEQATKIIYAGVGADEFFYAYTQKRSYKNYSVMVCRMSFKRLQFYNSQELMDIYGKFA